LGVDVDVVVDLDGDGNVEVDATAEQDRTSTFSGTPEAADLHSDGASSRRAKRRIAMLRAIL